MSISPLATRVRQTLLEHQLVSRGDRVLVALSGGPDSVALGHVLIELEVDGLVEVAGFAHLNHSLRARAVDDEAFCERMAAALGRRFTSERADVRAAARTWRTSLEDAGRRLRYDFLERAASDLNARRVATGHTLDDQAETLLLRLARGAGLRGLGGIHPKAGRVIRPLIEVRRAEVRSYLEDRGIEFREDESNLDLSYARNRVRHRLLPLLERDFSPRIVEILAREASLARDEDDRLQQEAIEAAGSVVLVHDECGEAVPWTAAAIDEVRAGRAPACVEVRLPSLGELHPALASRVLRLALEVLGAGRFIGWDHVGRLRRFAREARDGAALSLPGQQALRRGAALRLTRRGPQPFSNSFPVPLSIPGEAALEGHGWVVSAQEMAPGQALPEPFSACGLTVAVPAAALTPPLAVRTRRRGDRFRPLGMGGRAKKLQDFLVDRKVPREERDRLPIVVDRNDRIVWVVGHSVAEDFRVTEPSPAVILLKARRLGGAG